MSYEYASPYGRGSATPNGDYHAWTSASPTPSPRHGYWQQPPQRPATRATHSRHVSSGGYDDYRAAFSPRFTSTGEYATGGPGPRPKVSPRKPSFSGSRQVPKRERRSSYSYYRTPHGDSDEDEYIEVDGVTYVLPAQSRSRRYHDYYPAARHGTDYSYYKQAHPPYEKYEKTAYYEDPVPQRSATRLGGHARRASASMPIPRPQTARPSSAHKHAAPPVAKATEADARKHQIPRGYSLKNWDPTEEPIMLLGSVFDPNSLGKWIYDWTVYRHGANTPIPDMAGELWLLLIQLSGKMKRSEEVMDDVRTKDNREMLNDFIESGERLTDRLRALLKRCEAPMLNAARDTGAPQLDKRSGVEFVKTIWGRERELERTERFMQQLRLWNHRFDTNCDEILKMPSK